MPAIRFDSFAGLDNRADAVTMNVWRVSQVDDDLGGRTTVSYAQKLVCNNQPPAGSWVWNTQDCYPRWTTNNGSQGWGAFNRYLVASVTSSDKVAGGPSTVVAYNYEGDAAYRYDTSPFTTNKTWSEPHGYTAVTTISGPGSNATYTKTRQQFYRGMHGDSTGAGGTKSFSVTYYDGTVTADDWWFNGRAFTNETYDYATSGLVERTDTTLTPVTTANYGSQLAVRLDVTKATHTSLEVGGFHTTQTRTVFDAYGFPIETWDIGNVWDGVDDTCTYTEYVRGALQLQYWNLGLPVFSVRTAGSPSYPGGFAGYCDETPGNELGYTKWRYDWLAVGANTTGLVTSTSTRALATAPWLETLSAYNAQNKLASVDGPVAGTSDTTSYLYDSFGHRNAVTDATGHRVNQITDPGRGSVLSISDLNNRTVPSVDDGADKVTTYGYDTVGRVTNVLLPGDSSPSGTVSYTLSVDAQSLVNAPPKITKVTKVTAADSVTTVTYLDGLGRTRETQTSGPNGGRIVSASQYDGRSQVIKSFTGRYLDANTPGDGLWTAGCVQLGVTRIGNQDGV